MYIRGGVVKATFNKSCRNGGFFVPCYPAWTLCPTLLQCWSCQFYCKTTKNIALHIQMWGFVQTVKLITLASFDVGCQKNKEKTNKLTVRQLFISWLSGWCLLHGGYCWLDKHLKPKVWWPWRLKAWPLRRFVCTDNMKVSASSLHRKFTESLMTAACPTSFHCWHTRIYEQCVYYW